MKKKLLIALTVLLVSGFTVSNGVQSVMAAEKDKYGGILRICTSKSPTIIGYPPEIRGSNQEAAGHALEFMALTTRKNVVEPRLATGWKISPDGKAFTFKLRKGVKFHDGTDFNAEAAKYNLDLWLKTPGPVLNKLKSVDIIDDYTIRANFSEFDALVMYEISVEAYIASPTAMEKNGVEWAKTHPVGTGPFKFKNFERNVVLKFERNENYWRKGRPYLDGFDYVIIKDPMTRMATLKVGDVHGVQNIKPEHAAMLEKEGYVLSRWHGPCVGIEGDSKNPNSPWSNRKVREAISYTLDREAISNDLGLGYIPVLYQLVTPGNPFYNPDLKPRKHNLEKAKKLLAEAGYPDGFKTTFIYFLAHWPESWQAIQGQLRKVGIDAKLDVVDRPKLMDIRYGGGPENSASHNIWMGETNLLYSIKNMLSAKGRRHPNMARPAGFDELIEKAVKEIDPGKRKVFLQQLAKMIYDDVTFIPLNIEERLFVGHKDVHGLNYTTYTSAGQDIIVNAWISKK